MVVPCEWPEWLLIGGMNKKSDSVEADPSGAAASTSQKSRPQPAHTANAEARGFGKTGTWIFDLDNTLYPAECNLFAEVDRRMSEFIAKYLGVPRPNPRHIHNINYRQFGTTLSGLMLVHKMQPGPFLDYVHDIDLSAITEAPELRAAIQALDGRKLIFTNGSRRHAERVAGKLGVLDLMEDICDIAACEFVPNPDRAAFETMMRLHGVAPSTAAMFEDMPHNLEAPHALGMTTVLVHSSYIDHPSQIAMRSWTELPGHVHHLTHDLTSFLNTVKQLP
jgi:putative hydrolase of the HAD superfamily